MSRRVSVVGLPGSLRSESKTRVGIGVALETASAAGAETELIDLRELDVPPLDDDEDPTDDVEGMKETLASADAILLGTPMYHGSYSGVLKNALDHCGFNEFEDKTVGLLAVSGGSFPITALEHLRSVCRALNAWVLPWEAAIPRASDAIAEGDIIDEQLAERVETLGQRTVEYARIEPHQAAFESEQNVGAVGR